MRLGPSFREKTWQHVIGLSMFIFFSLARGECGPLIIVGPQRILKLWKICHYFKVYYYSQNDCRTRCYLLVFIFYTFYQPEDLRIHTISYSSQPHKDLLCEFVLNVSK